MARLMNTHTHTLPVTEHDLKTTSDNIYISASIRQLISGFCSPQRAEHGSVNKALLFSFVDYYMFNMHGLV